MLSRWCWSHVDDNLLNPPSLRPRWLPRAQGVDHAGSTRHSLEALSRLAERE